MNIELKATCQGLSLAAWAPAVYSRACWTGTPYRAINSYISESKGEVASDCQFYLISQKAVAGHSMSRTSASCLSALGSCRDPRWTFGVGFCCARNEHACVGDPALNPLKWTKSNAGIGFCVESCVGFHFCVESCMAALDPALNPALALNPAVDPALNQGSLR